MLDVGHIDSFTSWNLFVLKLNTFHACGVMWPNVIDGGRLVSVRPCLEKRNNCQLSIHLEYIQCHFEHRIGADETLDLPFCRITIHRPIFFQQTKTCYFSRRLFSRQVQYQYNTNSNMWARLTYCECRWSFCYTDRPTDQPTDRSNFVFFSAQTNLIGIRKPLVMDFLLCCCSPNKSICYYIPFFGELKRFDSIQSFPFISFD